MWDISVQGTVKNVAEEGSWLADIALSLLRALVGKDLGHLQPTLGDVEAAPFTPHQMADPSRILSDGLIHAEFNRSRHYLINDAAAETIAGQNFQAIASQLFWPSAGSLAERVGQGLGWLTRGRRASERSTRLLYAFTALEALLSDQDKTAPVVQTIARNAATILTNDNAERAEAARQLKILYGARSALVHAGKRNVSHADANAVQLIAEELFTRVPDKCDLGRNYDSFNQELAKCSYGLSWPTE